MQKCFALLNIFSEIINNLLVIHYLKSNVKFQEKEKKRFY